MKSTRITLVVVSLLLASFTWGAGTSGGGGACLAKHLDDLGKKHAQLYKWLYDIQDAAKARIISKKRWKDKDFPLGEAQVDIQASTAKCHEVSAASGGPGPETVKSHAEVFSNDRVCEVDKTSLENAGAGIGYIVKDSGLGDVETSQLLKNVDGVILPGKQIFKDMDITVAEVCDSVRVIRQAGIDIPSEHWSTGGLRSGNGGAGSRPVSELVIVGKEVRSGTSVSGFGIDLKNPQYADTKIDYLLGNDKCVQVGLSLDTITTKWADSDDRKKMANAIAKDKFLEPNRRMTFKYLDPNGAKPTQAKIESLNSEIVNPALWVTADDFIPATAIP